MTNIGLKNMNNEQEKLMFKKMLRFFYKKFWLKIITFIVLIIALIVLLILGFVRNQMDKDFLLMIMYSILLVGLMVLTFISMKAMLRDLIYIKSHKPKIIVGKAIRYRKVVHAGDPDTVSYYPTIRDIDNENIEVEVNTKNTELNKTYYCVYLPNTKMAVCEELTEKENSLE